MAAALMATAPVLAQEAPTEIPITTTPPSTTGSETTVGPRELENFSLDGQVTRRAAPPAQQQPAVPPPAAEASAGSQPAPQQASPVRQAIAATARPAPQANAPERSAVTSGPASVVAGAAPSVTAATAAPAFSGLGQESSVVPPADNGFSPLPWIAALLLLAAGAVIYFGQQKRRQRLAGHDHQYDSAPTAPLPRAPEPKPAAKPLAHAATAPVGIRPDRKPPTTLIPKPASPPAGVPGGIVSSSLRPWLEIEFTPMQAAVSDDHAAVLFEVTLFNSGAAPARDVAVEATLLNAGAQQDQRLAEFFGMPGKVKDTIPLIGPLGRISLKSAIRLKREAVLEYEVEGRKLFMPMAAVNARYRWSSGEGHSGAAFLVGRTGEDKEKLGPLRVDQGAKTWKGLGSRRYEKGLRR